MINKIKTLALSLMVAGATVTATRAPAATAYTNVQVLDKVNIALTLYSQGALKTTTSGKSESLPAVKTSLTTADIIDQLASVSGLFTAAKSDSLVYSVIYSNFLVGTAGTTITNSTTTLSNTTNVYI